MSKVRVSAYSISMDGFGAAPGQSLQNPFGVGGMAVTTPARGEWEMEWKGWWGPNPPYHVPVFVLTHHARPSLEMEGGNIFHFVTGGIHEALSMARAAAGDKDIRIGGGSATIRQYLEAGLIDELHFAVSPVLLGAGESPINGLNLPALGYEVADRKFGENAMHVFIRKEIRKQEAA